MQRKMIFVVFVLGFAATLFGQSTVGASERSSAAFEADFPAGSLLLLHVRSGDVRLLGGDQDKIVVRYEGANADRGREVRVTLVRSGQTGDLSIHGGPHNDFRIVVQVPRRLNLKVRMPFGNLVISAIAGDKDVEVHAGDVTLEIGQSAQYAHVDLSVSSGELSAGTFGVEKAGLFRSFETKGTGSYRLHAHLGAGDLTIKN
ncbi:MAG TPA: hypothetical protein VHR45_07745 [Thermoanaerobaculia bacterium]|nr:hypothetical protein [Thermoanaerobaculia bacterium]